MQDADFLAEVQAFQNETGIRDSELTRQAGIESSTIFRLRQGASPRGVTVMRIRAAMAFFRNKIAAELEAAAAAGRAAGSR